MRTAFNYYRIIQSVNIPFSIVLGLLYGIEAFLLSFCTCGLVLSVFYFELFYKQQYYFYYNKGFSKLKLFGLAFLGNIALCALFLLIKVAVQ